MNKSSHKLTRFNDVREKNNSELIWSSVSVISINYAGPEEKRLMLSREQEAKRSGGRANVCMSAFNTLQQTLLQARDDRA